MPYISIGKNTLAFDIAPGDTITEISPADIPCNWNRERFRQALRSARFDGFLSHGKPLVVVNDAFRPTPTGLILAEIAALYPDFRADFLVACGNHPAPGAAEIEAVFAGYQRPEDSRLFFHDSHHPETMQPAGQVDGHTLYLNRLLFDYPAVMVIGSVEPHYFAGFTGGRKSLVPGLCDHESIRRNHALAVSAKARPLRLKGNPVAEHLEQMMTLVEIPNLFSVQIVTGRDARIAGCFCGSLADSFAAAAAFSEGIYARPVEGEYDLVLAEMHPPLDRNLYQIQKGIENCAAVVRDGGEILVVSACSEGIGNDEFFRLAAKLQTREAVLSQAAMDTPPMGIHKLSRIVSLSHRIKVKALTGLEPDLLQRVFLESVESLTTELHMLRQGTRRNLHILLVRDAGVLVAMNNMTQ